jgi:hypothetical protein
MNGTMPKRSAVWRILALVVLGLGTAGGVISFIVAPTYLREVESLVSDELRGSCTVLKTVVVDRFEWSRQLTTDGYLRTGTEVDDVSKCDELKNAFGPNIERIVIPAEYNTTWERDWFKDIGRRLLLLLAGGAVGGLLALPFLAIFHIVRTSEEARDFQHIQSSH